MKIKTVIDPNKPPINTSGIIIFTVDSLLGEIKLISSIKAEKSKKQASDALPTLYPLVFALVTFPKASSLSVIILTSAGY